jgi:RNA polymerase sigma-70 factor (ECF subfamily)
MEEAAAHGITDLLLAWRQGQSSALDKLAPLVYSELRHLAHRYMRGERRGHTLETTALVNEAYLCAGSAGNGERALSVSE